MRFATLLMVLGPSTIALAGVVPRKIAVVLAVTSDLPATSALDAMGEVEQAMRAQGAEPVMRAAQSADAACRAAACIKDIARKAGTDHVLRLEVVYARESFKVRGDMWSAEAGRITDSAERACEVCTATDFNKAVREVVTQLATSAAAEGGAGTINIPAAPPARAADDRGGSSFVPWLVTGAGGPMLAVSGWFLAHHHQGIDCHATVAGGEVCEQRRNTLAPAAAWGGAGIAAVGLGLWMALREQNSGTKVILAAGPHGVVLSGGF